ncbi:MAG TPA: DUF4397 domain-containing protein [Streptosporangiaceae bacterium]|jgi:hypothetical protein
MTRLIRAAAAAGLAAGLVAFTAPAASAHSGDGWLRLAHLSPNTPAVDVYLYSFNNPNAKIVLHHVAYGTVSGYEKVPAGEYTVAMRGAGAKSSSKPVLSTTVNVTSGKAYTVAGMGPASGLRLQVLDDQLTTPAGKSLVRVIQASLNEQRVTVTAAGKTIADKLAFSKITSYQTVSPGDWSVHATGANESGSATVKLASGAIYTLVVLDDPGHLTIDSLEDAAASQVAPAGAPATGFGGTAPRPGAPLLPWLVTGGIGLIVVAGGAARLMRRPRRRAAHAR